MACFSTRTVEAEKLTVGRIRKKVGKDPLEAFFDLMIEDNGVAGAYTIVLI